MPRTVSRITRKGIRTAACADIRKALDHRMLNEIAGLEKPSLESLAVWIWAGLAPGLASLSRITVRRDSMGQSCTYTGGA